LTTNGRFILHFGFATVQRGTIHAFWKKPVATPAIMWPIA
jgi:hypothetical protein